MASFSTRLAVWQQQQVHAQPQAEPAGWAAPDTQLLIERYAASPSALLQESLT